MHFPRLEFKTTRLSTYEGTYATLKNYHDLTSVFYVFGLAGYVLPFGAWTRWPSIIALTVGLLLNILLIRVFAEHERNKPIDQEDHL